MNASPQLKLEQTQVCEPNDNFAEKFQRDLFIRAMEQASEAVNQMTYIQPHELTLEAAHRIQGHMMKAFAAWTTVCVLKEGNPPPRRGD